MAAAKLLAGLFGVPWAEAGTVGPFSPVYSNAGLTLDFDETTEPFPIHHYCFRVEEEAFNAILGRIRVAGIPYRSTPHGRSTCRSIPITGGSIVYWSEPDGHIWELLTVSYARQRLPDAMDAQ